MCKGIKKKPSDGENKRETTLLSDKQLQVKGGSGRGGAESSPGVIPKGWKAGWKENHQEEVACRVGCAEILLFLIGFCLALSRATFN